MLNGSRTCTASKSYDFYKRHLKVGWAYIRVVAITNGMESPAQIGGRGSLRSALANIV